MPPDMKPRVNYLFHMSQSLLIIGLFQESESYFLPTQLSIYSTNTYKYIQYCITVPGTDPNVSFKMSTKMLESYSIKKDNIRGEV